jgi:hypothetical protein
VIKIPEAGADTVDTDPPGLLSWFALSETL